MIGTKVVDTANDIHSSQQGFRVLRQTAAAASQRGQVLAKGGVEPFNESGVNAALTLRDLYQPLNQVSPALDDPPLNRQGAFSPAFDHLDNGKLRPSPPLTPPRLPQPRHFGTKRSLKGFDIAREAIDRQQQRPTQSNRPNLIRHSLDQAFVPLRADGPAQPQPGRDHHRQGHPKVASLALDLDFIRLGLLQVQLALPHRMFVDFLAMLPRSLPPAFDRPLIKAIGRHYRLPGTAMGQQRQDRYHHLGLGFEPIEDAAFTGRKRSLADVADIPLVLLTMAPDVSSPGLPSCRTLKIKAKYLLWVHRSHSWFWSRNLPVCPMSPLFSNSLPYSRFIAVLPVLSFITKILVMPKSSLSSTGAVLAHST
jgi:hypothetical protein